MGKMRDLALIILLTIIGMSAVVGAQAVDGTLTEQAAGGSVVWATLHKLRKSSIFPDDHLFMDSVAWVESSFGKNLATFQRANIKGIWNEPKSWRRRCSQWLLCFWRSSDLFKLDEGINIMDFKSK